MDMSQPFMRRSLAIFEDILGAEYPYAVTVRKNLELLIDEYRK